MGKLVETERNRGRVTRVPWKLGERGGEGVGEGRKDKKDDTRRIFKIYGKQRKGEREK